MTKFWLLKIAAIIGLQAKQSNKGLTILISFVLSQGRKEGRIKDSVFEMRMKHCIRGNEKRNDDSGNRFPFLE